MGVLGTLTVACDIAFGVRLGDVASTLADDDAELNCEKHMSMRAAVSARARGVGDQTCADLHSVR